MTDLLTMIRHDPRVVDVYVSRTRRTIVILFVNSRSASAWPGGFAQYLNDKELDRVIWHRLGATITMSSKSIMKWHTRRPRKAIC